MSLTSADIKKVAHLSRIHLSEEDEKEVLDRLNNIISWIDQLEEVDVSGINIMDLYTDEPTPEREDLVLSGNKIDVLKENAIDMNHDMFTVPKVIG